MHPVSIKRDELCSLIPHAGSMCLLDSVKQWDEDGIVCTAVSHRDPDNPLRSNGALGAVHALEYGAQAMAVHGGLLARARGERAPPGYLAALRDAQLHVERLDTLQAALRVEASCVMADAGNLIYAIRVSAADTAVASARATVITQPGETP